MIEGHWLPPPLYKGRDVFIIGGGPSFKGFDIRRLYGKDVITLNSSAYSCRGRGATLFFCDPDWLSLRLDLVKSWDGLVVTDVWESKELCYDRILYLAPVPDAVDFIIGEDRIKSGQSSGHSAISVAIALGAKRVILLGYDMRTVDGRHHHHDDYLEEPIPTLYSEQFIPGFNGWNAAANRAGVEVLNATPDSALDEFRKVSIDALGI